MESSPQSLTSHPTVLLKVAVHEWIKLFETIKTYEGGPETVANFIWHFENRHRPRHSSTVASFPVSNAGDGVDAHRSNAGYGVNSSSDEPQEYPEVDFARGGSEGVLSSSSRKVSEYVSDYVPSSHRDGRDGRDGVTATTVCVSVLVCMRPSRRVRILNMDKIAVPLHFHDPKTESTPNSLTLNPNHK